VSKFLTEAERRAIIDAWTLKQFAAHYAAMASAQANALANPIPELYGESWHMIGDAAARFGRPAQEAAFDAAIEVIVASEKVKPAGSFENDTGDQDEVGPTITAASRPS
jgi:hypothetical protein